MSWLRQVVHVMRYDARAMWPYFALHVGVLVYGVLQAHDHLPVRYGLNSAPLLLYGSAMLFAALLVHRHAPNSPVAHWSALPQEKTAVWAAKWFMLAALLACDVTAIMVALHDLPLSEERVSLYFNMKATSLCAVIASAALVGSLRRELRTVLLLLLGLPLASTVLFLLIVFSGRFGAMLSLDFRGLNNPGVLLLGTTGAMLVTLWMYRRRGAPEVSAMWVLSGAVVLMAGAMSATELHNNDSRSDPNTVRITPLVDDLANVRLEVDNEDVSDFTSSDERALVLRMEHAPATLRAQWTSSFRRTTRRGSATQFSATSSGLHLYTPSLPIFPAPVWLGSPGGDDPVSLENAPAWTVQRPAFTDGEGELSVSSAVRFSKPVIIARMPLAAGGVLESDTRQFRILKHGGGELICDEPQLVELCGASYPEGSLLRFQLRGGSSAEPDLSFALVNAKRGEAIRTHGPVAKHRDYSSHQMFVPGDIWNSEWLLIPGPYSVAPDVSAQLAIDQEWLQGAELVIVEWVTVGELPIEMPERAMAGAQ